MDATPPVAVRKARAPAKPRAEPAKAAPLRKKSPLNTSVTTTSNNNENGVANAGGVITGGPNAVPKPDDIDTLTSGMRKVKISLVTKEQREAREQSKTSTRPARPTKMSTNRVAKAKVVTKSAIGSGMITPTIPAPAQVKNDPPVQKTFPSDQNSLNPPTGDVAFSGTTGLPHNHASSAENVQNDTSRPQNTIPAGMASPPVVKSLSQQQSSSADDSTPDVFIPYQPEGPAQETRAMPSGLQWLPPNTATPSASKFGDLPVFTSTGAIPFGIKKESGRDNMGISDGPVQSSSVEHVKQEDAKRSDI